MWRIILGIVVIGVAIAGGAKVFERQIGEALFARALDVRFGTDVRDSLPEGLHVGLCGSGSPFPDESRSGPCAFVIAGERIFVVDMGTGASRTIGRLGIPVEETTALLLTHYHSDHISDLGDFMMLHWAGGANASPVPVYGPTGVRRVVEAFEEAYALDTSYRIAHHGEEIVPPSGGGGQPIEFTLPIGPYPSRVVYDVDGLQITAFSVAHSPIEPAVGYRFDYAGRSVVISGDTSQSAAVTHHATDADVLLHDALQPRFVNRLRDVASDRGVENLATIMIDIQDYHATTDQAAQVAKDAGVDQLVLTHVVPMVPLGFMHSAFLGDARDHFDGPITVGEDGMMWSLPADDPDRITFRHLLD